MFNLKKYMINRLSCKYFLVLTCILSIFTYFLISKQIKIGIYYWDIFLYLNNAMTFAGIPLGDTMYLPPLLPFLYSLFFRMGLVNEIIIFIICGIFYILGGLGFYLLLNLRFKPWECLVGALIYSTSTIVLIWSVTGALDVPSISLCIWAVYLTLLAIKKDSKIFYISFPISMLAFLARFTSGLILLPIFGVILFNSKKINLKDTIIGMGIACLIYLPFMINFNLKVGSFFPFIKQLSNSALGNVSSVNPGFNLDLMYYLKFLPEYISSFAMQNYIDIITPHKSNATILSFIILAILILGLIIYTYKFIKRFKEINNKDFLFYLLSFIFIIMSAILIFSYGHVSYIYHELILVTLTIIFYITIKIDTQYLDLDFAFILWFLSFFIMHSAHSVKVDRYFITMIPSIAYATTLGIHELNNFELIPKIGSYNVSKIISIFLIVCILFSTSTYIFNIPTDVPEVIVERTTTQWLINNDSNILDKKIASDRGPAFTWYFKKYVYTRVYHNETAKLFHELMINTKADYYIKTNKNNPFNVENYTKIATINGSTDIYKLNNIT